MARPQESRDGEGRGPGGQSTTAIGAAVVIGLLAAAGWLSPRVGLAIPIGAAVSVMVLAPIAFGWSATVQGVVAAAGIAGYVTCVPSDAVVPERLPSVIVGLSLGLIVSVVATVLLDGQHEAERLERQRTAKKTQEALAGLEIRAGVGSLTHGGGSPDLDADDPVASIERIAVGLGRAMVEQRKAILHEREMNAHFIGQAAHEFRTPLAVIQTAAEALKLYSGRMSSHAQHIRLVKIEDSVQQMTDLLRNALTFSRADAGKIKCERQPVDLRAVAQEIARDIEANMGEHKIVVSMRGGARLPQVDPSLAREILINLLTNAAKYSPGGG